MPLTPGASEDIMTKNRRELWAKYKRTGEINGKKVSHKKARTMIEAIVHDKARESYGK